MKFIALTLFALTFSTQAFAGSKDPRVICAPVGGLPSQSNDLIANAIREAGILSVESISIPVFFVEGRIAQVCMTVTPR